MVNVQRANVFLTISDDDIDKYMAKGYSIVDDRGNVIKQSIPVDLLELQKAYTEHVNIIKQKDSEIATLRAQLKEAEAKKASAIPEGKVEEKATGKKKAAKDESWDDWEDAEEVEEEKPRKKRK